MNVIELSEAVKIYKTNIPYNKEDLIKELFFNIPKLFFNRFKISELIPERGQLYLCFNIVELYFQIF